MLTVVVLAAGKGTRMNDSDVPKVCRTVGGKPMLQRVIETAQQLCPDQICVVVSSDNHTEIDKITSKMQSKTSSKALSKTGSQTITLVRQQIVNGTASAVLSAEPVYQETDILVLLGDVPLIKPETLQKCLTTEACILGFLDDNHENKFGRIVLDDQNVERIVEYNEATSQEREITTVNSGMLFLKHPHTQLLKLIDNNNSKQEYYLTDIVKILRSYEIRVDYVEASKKECLGANTPAELETLEKYLTQL